MNDAKNGVHQLDGDETVKDFEAFKLVFFNNSDFFALFDRAATRFAVNAVYPNGSEKVKMARITERRNLCSWLPDFPILALIANQCLPSSKIYTVNLGEIRGERKDVFQHTRQLSSMWRIA